MKRKTALATIVADVFEHGRLTSLGIRAYLEGRISRRVLSQQMAIGQRLREQAIREGQPLNAATYKPKLF